MELILPSVKGYPRFLMPSCNSADDSDKGRLGARSECSASSALQNGPPSRHDFLYDRAAEFERPGSQTSELPRHDWEWIVLAPDEARIQERWPPSAAQCEAPRTGHTPI